MSSLFELKIFKEQLSQDLRIDKEIKAIKDNLSSYRYQHSIDVAALALKLCELFFSNFKNFSQLQNQVLHAALLHDFTKEWKAEQHLKFAQKYNFSSEISNLPFPLYHAVSGSKVAQFIFLHDDPKILEAILYHTTGFSPMPEISALLYCADYFASKKTPFKKIKQCSLEQLVFFKTRHTIEKLCEQGQPIHQNTYNLYQTLSKSLSGGSNKNKETLCL